MRRTIVHLSGFVALLVFGLVGCGGGGSSSVAPAANPGTCDGMPALLELSQPAGNVGEGILITGLNLSTDINRLTVLFHDASGEVTIEAPILATIDNGAHPALICRSTTIRVEVPPGALTGTVEVLVHTDDGKLLSAGELPFEAAPQIISFGSTATADPWILASPTSALLTTEFQIFGYNLEGLTGVEIVDSDGATIPGATILPGFGALVSPSYTLPDGLEVATIDIAGVAPSPLPCSVAYFQFRVLNGGAGVDLASNSVIVPVRVMYSPGVLEDMPGTISGCVVPTGVRRGVVDLTFTLTMQPAMSRYDVRPQYWDSATSTWIDCVGVDSDEGETLIPGVPGQVSPVAPMIAGGATHVFRWDTVSSGVWYDYLGPTDRATTRVRFIVENLADGPLFGLCETYSVFEARYESPTIVIDNPLDPGTGLVGRAGELFEGFDSTQADPTFPATALWNEGDSGALIDGPVAPDAPWGAGTTDINCSAVSAFSSFAGAYVFNTDTSEIIDVSDPTLPVVLHSPAVGDPPGVMRLRTLSIETATSISVVGSAPLRIHLAGTGNPDDIVCEVTSAVRLDGENGTGGTSSAPGVGGSGGAGGGDGGAGGMVLLSSSVTTAAGDIPAEDGGSNGGGAGTNVTYAKIGQASSAKAGPGGGGGAREAGAPGFSTFSSNFTLGAPGDGGPKRASDGALFDLTVGSGGGGGGGNVFRQTATASLRSDPGGGGGGGGGAIEIVANGAVRVASLISANGGDGGVGWTLHAGPGGGGSGGGILVRAVGDILVPSGGELQVIGGSGGATSNQFGGDGADGWIRLESNGIAQFPGTVDMSQLLTGNPTTRTSGFTAPGTVPGGTGINGPLAFSARPDGLYVIDTDGGEIHGPIPSDTTDPAEMLAFAALAPTVAVRSTPVEWNFTSVNIRDGIQLRAVGSTPLIIRVSGNCFIDGNGVDPTIDVSGFDGGLPDVSDATTPLGGIGGTGGPGAGDGGNGGQFLTTGVSNGADASLDFLPADYVAGTLSGPLPLPPLEGAERGITIIDASSTDSAGGGGGGGHGVAGSSGIGALSGQGGDNYGSIFFTNPLTGGPFPFGGSGGAGGGGSANTSGLYDHSPGTAGAGGGGYFELSVVGALTVTPNAIIHARGGDAFRAPLFGGNGGAGSGGGVLARCDGTVNFLGLVDARGGMANVSPTGAPYTVSGVVNGGNGGGGRIRIESTVGFAAPGVATVSATIGEFREATQFRTRARSKPRAITNRDGVHWDMIAIHDVLSDYAFLGSPSPGSTLEFQFEGAPESLDRPGSPGEFTGPFTSLDQLGDAAFLRVIYNIYSDTSTGGTLEIDFVGFNFVL